MSVKGFFKNVLSNDTKESGENENVSNSSNMNPNSGMSNFLSGTTKFLDSVQSKKNGLITDLSNKFSSFKLPTDHTDTEGHKKSHSKNQDSNNDDESSASEYGDDGDRPMYAEAPPVERQISVESVDSLPEEEAVRWQNDIKSLITNIIQLGPIAESQVAEFKTFISRHSGRSRIAKELKFQTKGMKNIPHQLLQQLSLFIGPFLKQCNETEDYSPAYTIMQLCFTLYHETVTKNDMAEQVYLFTTIRDQPIWQSMRFWNAAFFIALQRERALRQPPSTEVEVEAALQAEIDFQNDIAYSQLSKFLWRMYVLGIGSDLCNDFLRKQASATNLPNDKIKDIQKNLKIFFQSSE